MRKSLIIPILFLFGLGANAQKDTVGLENFEIPDSTSLGVPDGKAVSKEIGTSGGSITSDDGRVTLNFPAGALTKPTVISIQPTSNPLPNSAGKSYWFEPSGTQFREPVEVIYNFTAEEAENCPPELMGMAIQDKTGKWTLLEYEDWDSATNFLRGYIHHFSALSNVFHMWLNISKTELRVNQKATLDFVSYSTGEAALFLPSQKLNWKVNGHFPGSEFSGNIRPGSSRIGKNAKFEAAIYTAPNYLPVADTIVISCEVYVRVGKKKKKDVWRTFRKRVTIYDSYEISIVCEYEGRVDMGSRLSDKASATIWVYKQRLQMGDIQNYPPSVIKEASRAGCKEVIHTEGQLGLIHLHEAISHYKLTHLVPEVYFEMASLDIPLCKTQYRCRGNVNTAIINLFTKSLPNEINFIANGLPQTYNVQTGHNEKYKLIVKRVDR